MDLQYALLHGEIKWRKPYCEVIFADSVKERKDIAELTVLAEAHFP